MEKKTSEETAPDVTGHETMMGEEKGNKPRKEETGQRVRVPPATQTNEP